MRDTFSWVPTPEETAALAEMRGLLEGGLRANDESTPWLEAEEIALVEEPPDSKVVVHFRLVAEPDTLYGWAHPVWDSEEPDGRAAYLSMHLTEAALTRAGTGRFAPDARGVVWLPNFQDEF